MSRPLPIVALLSLALAVPALVFAGGEVSAKPGGKVKVIHGAPVWNDTFAAELKPGLNWRLGSNAATTLSTEGGMIFSDCVVFPGDYNLALVCDAADDYRLVFHHDGTYFKGTGSVEKAKLVMGTLDKKEFAKALLIDLGRDAAKKGYELTIDFGPNRLSQTFTSVKAKTVKGKAGTLGFSATYLERADLAELKKSLAESEVCVVKFESKSAKPMKGMLSVRGEPSLRFIPEGQAGSTSSLTGKEEQPKTKTPALALAFADAAGKAKTTFTVGDVSYVFEIEEKNFESVKAGGR